MLHFLNQLKKSPRCAEPEGLLPCSHQPSAFPYPEPDQSSPPLPTDFFKIHLNIILPSTTRSSDLPFPSGLPTKIQNALLSPIAQHVPFISLFSSLYEYNNALYLTSNNNNNNDNNIVNNDLDLLGKKKRNA
jgi:hypothetical protein